MKITPCRECLTYLWRYDTNRLKEAMMLFIANDKEANHAQLTKAEDISISVSRSGGIYWNELKLANDAELLDRLKKVAVAQPQPVV